MKVRISYTVNVDVGYRRAVVHYYSNDEPRLATRAEIQRWHEMHGVSMDDVLRDEHGACCWYDPA